MSLGSRGGCHHSHRRPGAPVIRRNQQPFKQTHTSLGLALCLHELQHQTLAQPALQAIATCYAAAYARRRRHA